MAATNGSANNYPEGQCTRYADQRYHDLTGFYVPWSGNAKDWATQAIAYGWTVSSTPVVPSIICLQGGIQGADATYGHVAVVESVAKASLTNAFSTQIVTSDLNWGPNYSAVSTVNFYSGPGVSFIYVKDAKGKPIASTDSSLVSMVNDFFSGGGGKSPISLSPTEDVTSLLWTWDQVLALNNPFANISAQQDSIAGLSFTDPISWVEGVSLNIVDDFVAMSLRLIFIIIGVIVIIKVISNFIDFGAVMNTAEKGIGTIAKAGLL